MTDRVELTLDGRRYVRRSGIWLSAATNLKAPATIAAQLDALAKSAGLWEKCLAEDITDNPRTRKRPRITLRVEADGTPICVAPRPLPKKEAHRRRHGDHPAEVEAAFKSNGRDLVLSCDFERGWRETATGWRFGASDTVMLPGDHRLRLTVTLLEDDRTVGVVRQWSECGSEASGAAIDLAELSSRCPAFPHHERQTSAIRYDLQDAGCSFLLLLLTAKDELNAELEWFEEDEHWHFHFRECRLYELPVRLNDDRLCVARPFRLELDATLLPPPKPELQSEYEYDTPMPSAGLPGLSKRRRT